MILRNQVGRPWWQASWLMLMLLGILVLSVYMPGRVGPFVADDYPNILDNNGVALKHLDGQSLASAWTANTSGALKRPFASVSFALNYYFAGQHFDRVAFKLTNITIHILNSFLVFFLSRLLITVVVPRYPAQRLAFLTALIWAAHPLQLTGVLYVVQRMTSMACFFMLSGFLVFLKGRLNIDKPSGIVYMAIGCFLGVTLGALAKENAILLPLLIAVCELTLMPAVSEKALRNKIYSFYAITVIIPILFCVGYLLKHPEHVLSGYQFRDFTLVERGMTESRILFYYLGLLFYPDNTQLGLFHDDFSLSKGFLEPANTLLSMIGIISLIVVALNNSLRRKMPFLSFGILWFFVGHSIESTIYPLELIYEHRNYLPSIGIVIGSVVFVYEIFVKRVSEWMLNALYACIIVSLALATYARASIWSSLDSFSYFEVRNHPLSARTNSVYANSLELKHGPNVETYNHYLIAAQLNTFEVSTLLEVYLELNRLIYHHDVSKDQQNIALPRSYDAPLALDSSYMEALKVRIHEEILRRITAKTYPLRTMLGLRNAANCLINGDYECKNIAANLTEWVDAALAQPDFFDVPMIYLIKAKIYFNQGDVARALEFVDKAIALSPDRMYFYAEKAYLFVTLNQFDNAEHVIRHAENLGTANGFDAQEFQTLRDAMRRKNLVAEPTVPQ
ncbi:MULTISPECIES: tetratricopeptide repeat protein [Methylomonas]|uniref:Uncharacterized protein n=2 Tax=Methylomonas TaxID=416 RepID=A0A126T1A4_9GAMM|nr:MULTISPECIES: hypothetical protein [Methylomonas]AMK75871.1 hypothetical protein JT25_005110 [Methylomonas denitrificans]OAI01364.1 hypothetical protein A1342_15580 [Methylomonas methanica]TCV79254.1 hypothetical protein EDE11_12047 [Methylomonas methanica]